MVDIRKPIVYSRELLLSFRDHMSCSLKPDDFADFLDKDNLESHLLVGSRVYKSKPRSQTHTPDEEQTHTPEQEAGHRNNRNARRTDNSRRSSDVYNVGVDSQTSESRRQGGSRNAKHGTPNRQPLEVPPNRSINLDQFTLSDIRQAEAALQSGMSMHEYTNRVRAGNIQKVPESSSFFVEEEGAGPRWGRQKRGEEISRSKTAPTIAPAANLLNLLGKPAPPAPAPPAARRVNVKDLFSLAQGTQMNHPGARPALSPAELQAQQFSQREAPPPPPSGPPKPVPAALPAEMLSALQAHAKLSGDPSPSDCQQS